MVIAAAVLFGSSTLPAGAQAQAQEYRFALRNGQTVCGVVLAEQAATITVQGPGNTQLVLRRDQILRRAAEPCEAPAPRTAAGPTPPAAPVAGQPWHELRIFGSDAMANRLIPDLVDAYIARMNLRPRGWAPGAIPDQRVQDALANAGQVPMRFTVTSTVTGAAFPALAERRSDIGLAARPPNAREIELVRAGAGFDMRNVEQVIALDGLAAVVHASNPVRRITMEQFREIFAGSITNWSALGGPDRPIRLYAREPEAAAMQVIQQEVMGRVQVAASTTRIPAWTDLSNAVADDPDGIAILTLAFIGRGRALNLVASCGIEFEASEFGLRTQDYPLERRFALYPSPTAPSFSEDFLEYMLSADAYDVVREAGYTSMQPVVGTRDYTQFRLLDATRAAPSAPDPRYMEAMGDYSVVVRNSVRLSTTFRFEAGSFQLDRRGLRDLDRVTQFLRSADGQRYRVNVLGFTDAVGAFGVNRSLSLRRAQAVADLLRQRNVTVHQMRGYASVAPVACDDDPNAPIKNRRVEIWLTPT
ncbi:MAG TPA: substrate-binding domain-containing protein [Acetobacteraceae bacterium]|nr:substrate-binding domain-containing protein [Acetobacteraceae bacterium]